VIDLPTANEHVRVYIAAGGPYDGDSDADTPSRGGQHLAVQRRRQHHVAGVAVAVDQRRTARTAAAAHRSPGTARDRWTTVVPRHASCRTEASYVKLKFHGTDTDFLAYFRARILRRTTILADLAADFCPTRALFLNVYDVRVLYMINCRVHVYKITR